jgi:hypothetical protein
LNEKMNITSTDPQYDYKMVRYDLYWFMLQPSN